MLRSIEDQIKSDGDYIQTQFTIARKKEVIENSFLDSVSIARSIIHCMIPLAQRTAQPCVARRTQESHHRLKLSARAKVGAP